LAAVSNLTGPNLNPNPPPKVTPVSKSVASPPRMAMTESGRSLAAT
jgi:hypothetical protein